LKNGSARTRLPVAVKMALARAGRIGGKAGSPNPLGCIGLQVMHLDLGWRLGEAHHGMLIVIGLHHAALFERDLLRHELAQAIDNSALDDVIRRAGIDDLTSHIGSHPNLVDLHFVSGIDFDFGHFGKIS